MTLTSILRTLSASVMSCLLLAAAQAADLRIPVAGHGTLIVDLPAGWTAEAGDPGFGPPHMVRFNAPAVAGGPAPRLTLNLGWVRDGKPTREDMMDSLQKVAQQSMQLLKLEKAPAITTFAEGPAGGAYFTSPVKSSRVNFTHAVTGFAAIDNVIMQVIMLTPSDDAALYEQAIRMLKTMRREAEGPPPTPAGNPPGRLATRIDGEYLVMSVPTSRAILRLPLKDWEPDRFAIGGGPSITPSGHPRYFLLSGREKGFTMSGWFEASARFTSAAEANPEVPLAGSGMHQAPRLQAAGPWETLSYRMVYNPTMSQTFLHAHRQVAGTWIDLKLSTMLDLPDDERRARLLEKLAAIEVVQRP